MIPKKPKHVDHRPWTMFQNGRPKTKSAIFCSAIHFESIIGYVIVYYMGSMTVIPGMMSPPLNRSTVAFDVPS